MDARVPAPSSGRMTDPLILTLAFDPATFAALDGWRRRWFPDRGYVLPAHLTLFHKLPGEEADAIRLHLHHLAGSLAPMPLRVAGPLRLGSGTGLGVECPAIGPVRKALARRWEGWLSPQDRHFRAHVTIQNKVPHETAERDRLDIAALPPLDGEATGFLLWHYRGGPWEDAGAYRFGGIE